MLRFLAIAAACLGLWGCAKTTTPIVSPEVPIEEPTKPVESTRTDLPINWFEVKGEDYSYGLPISFNKTTIGLAPEVQTKHVSLQLLLDVFLVKHNTDVDDLQLFVLSDFIMPAIIEGKQVLATKENNSLERKVIVVHLLEKVPQGEREKRDASLNFFVKRDKTIFYLGCVAEATNLVKHADICFKVVETLKIK